MDVAYPSALAFRSSAVCFALLILLQPHRTGVSLYCFQAQFYYFRFLLLLHFNLIRHTLFIALLLFLFSLFCIFQRFIHTVTQQCACPADNRNCNPIIAKFFRGMACFIIQPEGGKFIVWRRKSTLQNEGREGWRKAHVWVRNVDKHGKLQINCYDF